MKARISILLIMMTLMFQACTRNNGDIGDWFGEWRLDGITSDGTDILLYGEGAPTPDPTLGQALVYSFAFQSNVVVLRTVYPYHVVSVCTGTWREADGSLILQFTYHDYDGKIGYTPPSTIPLSPSGVTVLKILSMNDGRLKLSWCSDSGTEYVYYLSKRP